MLIPFIRVGAAAPRRVSEEESMGVLPPVLDAAHEGAEGRVADAATGIAQSRNWPVVAEALELVLHRLRENGAVGVRFLGRLVGEFRIEVSRVESIDLEEGRRSAGGA
jgi:hypothetical protein